MKYLVLFMESDDAMPVDMLSRPISPESPTRPKTEIARLLDNAEPNSRRRVAGASIDGYTTIDVEDHDAALQLARSWKWTGGVEILPLTERAQSA